MTSPTLHRHGASSPAEDERYGLDLLASVIDDVAAQLPSSNLESSNLEPSSAEPSYVVPMTSSETATPATRSVEAALPSPTLERAHRTSRRMALAAAVLIALMAWPAYLGWVKLPKVQQQLAEAQTAAGPVDLAWLSPPRQGERGASSTPTTQLALPPEGSVVWLLELPRDVRPQLQQGARIELAPLSSDGAALEPILAWNLDADSLEDHLARHDGVPLLLQANGLEPGVVRLQWLDASGNPVSGMDLELVNP